MEAFDIAEDEQLIGCELHQYKENTDSEFHFIGVTWIKMKVTI